MTKNRGLTTTSDDTVEYHRLRRSGGTADRRPWLAVDSEGVDDEDGRWGPVGRHWPMVFTAASDDGYESTLSHGATGKPLGTQEMLAWILALPDTYRLCGYFFRYDQNMLFHELPADALRALYPVGGGGGGIMVGDIEVTRFHTRLDLYDHATKQHRVIWDLGTFFNSSFLTAIESWSLPTDSEHAMIERWKKARSSFTVALWCRRWRDITEYSLLEDRLLSRLAARLDAEADTIGAPLSSWYSSGSLASSLLRAHGLMGAIEASAAAVPEGMREGVDAAYYGGRFEIVGPGLITEAVYEYDINSAYPAAMTHLPCVEHGAWACVPERAVEEYDLVFVTWHVHALRHAAPMWGPFPVRDRKGSIFFPLSGSGWYWGIEIRAAQAWLGGRLELQIHERWAYATDCDCAPMSWVGDIYERRKREGGTTGAMLKIAINSLYGSLTSVHKSTWQPIWAGWITARTRGMLLAACAADEDAVLMFATDAVLSTRPLTLDVGPGLGQWEESRYECTGDSPGLLVQPGVYLLPGEKKEKRRTRGFYLPAENVPDLYAVWNHEGWDGVYSPPRTERFMTIRAALQRSDLDQAWRWSLPPHGIRFDASKTKRIAPYWPTAGSAVLRLHPRGWMKNSKASVPYMKFRARWALGEQRQTIPVLQLQLPLWETGGLDSSVGEQLSQDWGVQ